MADVNLRPAFSFVRGVIAAAAVVVHDAYEASPLAVHKLADKLIDAHLDRAHITAMTDPVYAQIQARRAPDPGTILWELNAEFALSQAEEEIQKSIRDRLAPDPLWWPLGGQRRRTCPADSPGAAIRACWPDD